MKPPLWAGLALSAVAAAVVAAACTSPYIADVASYSAVLALFAVAVGLTYGQLGYVSFGHAAFLGVGAYTVGLLAAHTGFGYWTLVPVAIVPGLALGALVGLASVRVGGAYFAIATLTLAEMLRLVALDWTGLTRGPMGLMVVVPPLPWIHAFGWSAQQGYLFVLVAVLGIVLSVLSRLIDGPIGRRWTMIRQAPALAESVGVPTIRSRVFNVALSGGIASLAGGLLIPKAMVLSPDLFGTTMSAAGLLSVILGGKSTLIGPVIGGIVFGAVPEALRAIDEYRLGIFAILLLLAVRLLPEGVVSLWPRRWRPADPPHAAAAAAATAGGSLNSLLRPPLSDSRAATLEVDSLTRVFGGLTAVRNVGFRVEHGELVGLIGPNGAGKTTCLSMLSGFLRPSQGSVHFEGEPIASASPSRLAAKGLVRSFQHSACFSQLTVEANVLHACHLLHPEPPWSGIVQTAAYRRREAERVAHARRCLEAVGLADRAGATAAVLPYGEQKLLGVAIALAARPRVLLLDEPAAGLNHAEGLRLGAVLERLNRDGCTIVVVDHNLALLMSICRRLIVLQHGEKIADGEPQAVASHERVLAAYLGVSPTAAAEAGTA